MIERKTFKFDSREKAEEMKEYLKKVLELKSVLDGHSTIFTNKNYSVYVNGGSAVIVEIHATDNFEELNEVFNSFGRPITN